MIELQGIYTIRDTAQPNYWDVVFEWEDELSKIFGIPLIPVGKNYDKIYKPSVLRKILNRINFYQIKDQYFFNPTKYYLAFHIGPPGIYSFHSRRNVIPVIIDFWKHEDLRRFESIFFLNKLVFVTSREVYNYLVSKRLKVRLEHLALSLPDSLLSTKVNEAKEFDLIQLGRQNEELTGYINRLQKEFPGIDYVHGEKIEGKVYMISSRKGNLGEFKSRQSFLNLLGRSKVSLLSAPGLDNDRARTGGFSPVTPRFLESAVCGCHLVGTFPKNDDFGYFGINQICKNIGDYESFRTQVLNCLADQSTPDNREFLKNHLTSKRAEELKEKLSSYYDNQ